MWVVVVEYTRHFAINTKQFVSDSPKVYTFYENGFQTNVVPCEIYDNVSK